MATSFAGMVDRPEQASLAGAIAAGGVPRTMISPATGFGTRFGSGIRQIRPMKINFAAQVPAKPADTEL